MNRDSKNTIKRPLWEYALWISIGITLMAFLPYIVGWMFSPNIVYFAVYDASPIDVYAYYAMIEQVRQGYTLLSNTFTFEAGAPVLFHPLWFVLGELAVVTHVSSMVVYHIARAVGDVALLMTIFFLTQWVSSNARIRLLLLVFVGLSGGFAWIIAPWYYELQWPLHLLFPVLPSDAWITESNTFTTLLHTPLFSMTQALIVLVIVLYAKNLREPSVKRTLGLMSSIVILGLMHPYDFPIIFGIMLVHGWVFWIPSQSDRKRAIVRWIRQVGSYAIPALVIGGYFFWVGSVDPSIGLWAKQNITISPPLHTYLFGFGVLWIGLAAFAVDAWQRGFRNPNLSLLVSWLIVGALLVYAPVQVNRRWTHGVHIPFAILSGYGFLLLYRFGKTRWHWEWSWMRGLVLLGIILTSGTSLYVTARGMITALTYPMAFSARVEFQEAAQWVTSHTPRDARFLVHPTFAPQWTALTARPVYAGHGHQTWQWRTKLERLKRDWWYGNPLQQEQFLSDIAPDYVVITTDDPNPDAFQWNGSGYPMVFRNSVVTIYQFSRSPVVSSETSIEP